MKYLLAAVLLATALLLLGRPGPAEMPAGATAATETGHLLVIGSSTMAPLVRAMAKRYQELHPQVRIEVQTGGSGQGVARVRDGSADIGMVARPLATGEQELPGLPIARDGLALVVHQDNPVQSLTHAQVADIYTGAVTNWKHVGGRDAPILSIGAQAGRGSPELFARHFELPVEQLRVWRTSSDNAARLQLLREHPEAVAYLSLGEAERSIHDGAPLRLLPDEGVPATSRNVAKGVYPLARPLTLVTPRRPSALATAFVTFCTSSQVTDLILAHDFVPYLD